MSTLERAIEIAASAHAGQVDKAGQPYIMHPLRVMLSVSGNNERIVAVLHDVLEDCPDWTPQRLRGEGFGDHIIEALDRLTRRKGEDYMAFIARCNGPISQRVKIADITDNLNPTRLAALPKPDPERVAKYQVALALLQGGESNARFIAGPEVKG
jgi:(p)ppGpp synthase/HD superfamily hydrolase